MGHQISRRSFIRLASGAVLATSPLIGRAQSGSIKVGMSCITSGPVALTGTSSVAAVKFLFDKVNASGGINGRKLELLVRDSRALPEESVKNVRNLMNSDGCRIIIAAETSAGAAAVNEVARTSDVLFFHTAAEYSALTADPKQRSPHVFRTSRQGVHDAAGGALWFTRLAKERSYGRLATCSPDYQYGRDVTQLFVDNCKRFGSNLNVVSQSWPKLGASDYTEVVTKMLSSKADVIYSLCFSGDLLSLMEQGNLYGLFSNRAVFIPDLSEYGVIDKVKQIPPVAYTGSRYSMVYPPTAENRAWHDAIVKTSGGIRPTTWSWQAALAAQLAVNALTATGGEPRVDKMAQAIRGSTVQVPYGLNGKVTMRATDNAVIRYPLGFGMAQSAEPFVKSFESVNWDQVLESETAWLKRSNYV
ncbi:ABC transporter substrate-binding protein [Paraburkholderia tuberum]|uniref:ABC transporter substrate-binding protein n=1 Tax=Paraburkholderia tuberum TaxID=157910 RepID=UPI0014288B33|nr:ABC transporter substrate-binding protein [Paraburkholderia tuberum]